MPIKINIEVKLTPPSDVVGDTKPVEDYLSRQAGRTVAAAAKTWAQGVADGGMLCKGEWICEVHVDSTVTEPEPPIGEE